MKKFLLCALLSAMTLLSGCAGMELYRGVDPSTNAFVSTGYPQAQIQPAEGFKNVSFGAAYVRVAEEDGMFTVVPVDASYALYYSDRSQLAVVVAECGPYWLWDISSVAAEFRYLPILREFSGDRVQDATVRVYVRSGARDPWMPVFAEAGSSWEGDVLVARYEWCSSYDTSKLLVEYREPLPAPREELTGRQALVTEFLERSRAAFTLGPAPETVVKGGVRRNLNIPDRLLAPVIGAVTRPTILEDF
ncbi:DUF4851 domain-containing protein [uncultured Mailhella sp.]|uniref:DUF4851 domain-containing protein n=1 Tax=uncultured Mailhella sp. TaxID=1981031 RepID=UPI002604DD9A|nr:DUF4851 domain-containing protein [uncultured Mailhella sp.]